MEEKELGSYQEEQQTQKEKNDAAKNLLIKNINKNGQDVLQEQQQYNQQIIDEQSSSQG
jgi:hypothetical protein